MIPICFSIFHFNFLIETGFNRIITQLYLTMAQFIDKLTFNRLLFYFWRVPALSEKKEHCSISIFLHFCSHPSPQRSIVFLRSFSLRCPWITLHRQPMQQRLTTLSDNDTATKNDYKVYILSRRRPKYRIIKIDPGYSDVMRHSDAGSPSTSHREYSPRLKRNWRRVRKFLSAAPVSELKIAGNRSLMGPQKRTP